MENIVVFFDLDVIDISSPIRPNITPPKRWKFASTSSKSSTDSFTLFRKKGQGREKFFYTVVFTNVLSLIIGAGIGIWFFRRSSSEPDKILSA